MLKKLAVFFIVLSLLPIPLLNTSQVKAQASTFTWWLEGSTLKVAPDSPAPADVNIPLQLHAARSEYAPFQVVFRGGAEGFPALDLEFIYPTEFFELTVYEERYIDLPVVPDPEIFSLSRLTAPALPDGLLPLNGSLAIQPNTTHVVWVDVYVKPGTPAGDYSIMLGTTNGEVRETRIRVYDLDLPYTASMNIIIPVGIDGTIQYYAPGDAGDYHVAVNQVLLDHYIVPGTLAHEPHFSAEGWDFSEFTAELAQLPPGATFLTPIPFDRRYDVYFIYINDDDIYDVTNFGDDVFVGRVQRFLNEMTAYLAEQGRTTNAYVYPFDETRWVGDEPLHDGFRGFQRLAAWTDLIRQAGLQTLASGVSPIPPGPTSLGWLPTELVTDNTHVHLDVLDAAPELFQQWIAAGNDASVYLNEYGDLIDIPAGIQRGFAWHVYGRDIRTIMGYSALEWHNENYGLVDPLTEGDALYPVSGYGGGALVYPSAVPLPSIRLKLLREGVEDARLLDMYAITAGPEAARDFAACLTPGSLADQNPSKTLWDDAHTALLQNLTTGQPLPLDSLCISAPIYQQSQLVLDMDAVGGDLAGWDFEGVEAALAPSPSQTGNALQLNFVSEVPGAGYWIGGQNWDGWINLQVDVQNTESYFAQLDIGLTDDSGNFVLLRDGAVLIAPNSQQTLTLPLALPLDYEGTFNWGSVTYVSLEVSTMTTQTNAFGEVQTLPLGSRMLTFDNFILVR